MEQRGIPGVETGEGDESYVRNSFAQDIMTARCFPALSEVLQKLVLPAAEEGPLVVADLGCSSSANTINMVAKVVHILRDRYLSSGREVPDFQGCFSDLPANDFNTLLLLITSESRDFFVTSVPGSCYGRLLPRSSVQVFTCSHTLHWISQVPPAVLDPKSPAYNGSRIWLEGNSIETIEAYKQQAMADLRAFLSARAEELSPGGVLFCVFFCAAGDFFTVPKLLTPLSDLDAPSQDFTGLSMWRISEHIVEQMVSEGVVTKEQRASFNVPFCALSPEEVAEVLEDYAHAFNVEKLEAKSMSGTLTEEEWTQTQHKPSEAYVKHFMAVVGPFFRAQLGEYVCDLFQERYLSFVSKAHARGTYAHTFGSFVNHLMILSRK